MATLGFAPGTYIVPTALGPTIRATAAALEASAAQVPPSAALYCEKQGGFQCGSCQYVTPTNRTHGRCTVVEGTVHLADGCCVMWAANTTLLHLYRTK